MITRLKSLVLVIGLALVPAFVAAQTSGPAAPAPAPAAKPTFTEAQLQEGLRSGLTAFATQAIKPGSIKVPTPPFMTKLREDLVAKKKADTLDRFEATLDSVTKRLEPKVLDEVRKAIKSAKFADAGAVFAGGSKAATEALKTATMSSLKDAVLPGIRSEITAVDLAGKARAVFLAVNPEGLSAGNRVIV
ncbi:MAG: DUF4197 family protein, partial [Opitutaceae bacterium]|nr:DUF4197 family protein [Opitutaceae bacterium]